MWLATQTPTATAPCSSTTRSDDSGAACSCRSQATTARSTRTSAATPTSPRWANGSTTYSSGRSPLIANAPPAPVATDRTSPAPRTSTGTPTAGWPLASRTTPRIDPAGAATSRGSGTTPRSRGATNGAERTAKPPTLLSVAGACTTNVAVSDGSGSSTRPMSSVRPQQPVPSTVTNASRSGSPSGPTTSPSPRSSGGGAGLAASVSHGAAGSRRTNSGSGPTDDVRSHCGRRASARTSRSLARCRSRSTENAPSASVRSGGPSDGTTSAPTSEKPIVSNTTPARAARGSRVSRSRRTTTGASA